MITIIVAVYQDSEALEIILEALKIQSYKNFEVIVAQDSKSVEISTSIKKFKDLDIKHTIQDDLGWRKNSSLNNAIRASKGELLIFIDGDCIPNIDFIREYNRYKEPNTVLCGRRVELGSRYTKALRDGDIDIKEFQRGYLLNIFSLLKDKTRHYEEGIYLPHFLYSLKHRGRELGVLGCNFAVNREDIIDINGFNEEYSSPSVGEDTDIEYRLRIKGCKFIGVRNRAFVFHLYHKESYNKVDHSRSMEIFNRVKKSKEYRCKFGLIKSFS